MKDREELERVMKNYFYTPYKEFALAHIEPSVRLIADVGGRVIKGSSKFGGIPDLPKGKQWPELPGGKKLTFLCQINLKEIQNFSIQEKLPEWGMLYFFYDVDSWDKGHCFYAEDISDLHQPKPDASLTKKRNSWLGKLFGYKGYTKMVKEVSMSMELDLSIPSIDSLKYLKYCRENNFLFHQYPVCDEVVYEEDLLQMDMANIYKSDHRLLGVYHEIQVGGYELNFVNNKSFDGKYEKLDTRQIGEAMKWELLFQMDSDRNLELMFGDAGRLYFFIPSSALANRNFERVRMIGDCN